MFSPKHKVKEYIGCFCLRRNWNSLIYVDSSQSILFAGIKLISLASLACGHAFTGLSVFNFVNSFEMEDSVHRSSATTIRGAQICMPFFFLAGYFSSYTWIGKLVRNEGSASQGTMIKPLIRRLLRLMPSLACLIYFLSTKLYNFYSHPKWLEVVANDRINFRENGWINMLLLNNLINKRNTVILNTFSFYFFKNNNSKYF